MVYKLHQCFENISISAANSDQTCGLCKTKKKNDCCKTQFKIVKTSPAHKANLLQLDPLKFVAVLPRVSYLNPVFKISSTDNSSVRINAPPDKPAVALFITNCNFRI
jgi:hypothetical protein